MKRYLYVLLVVALATFAARATYAAEGGGSVFLQGTYGDFAAGAFGPPGLYLRNDLSLYDAGVGIRAAHGAIDAGIDQRIWLNMVKLNYISELTLFGGTYAAGIAIPIILDANVEGRLSTDTGINVARSGDRSGFGDAYATPIALNWARGPHNLTASLGVNVPIGYFEKNKQINLGRNYWALDPTLAYSYLGPNGWEVSATAGVLINFENNATSYRTGDEFHLDWLVAYHISQDFAFGVNGYWYEQIEKDKGRLPPGTSDGFRARGLGIGPAVMKSVSIGAHSFTLIGKWLHDVEEKNRMEGDLFMLSVATKF